MDHPKANPKVNAVLSGARAWREAFERLRAIVLDCGLTEELKWGQPCYSNEGRNVVLIHGFKDYCALLFMKGALMKDPNGVLIQQTKNVQSARQIRFRDAGEIVQLTPVIKAYVQEALELDRAGLKIEKKATADFPVAEAFLAELAASPALKTAFEALTPGRQRAYLLYFAAPKQAKTRAARVEKARPMILDGRGLDD